MLLMLACTSPVAPPQDSVVLTRHPHRLENTAGPQSSRLDRAPAPARWPLPTPKKRRTHQGLTEWRAPLPAWLDFHGAKGRNKPSGLRILGPEQLPFTPFDKPQAGAWSYLDGHIVLWVAGEAAPGDLEVTFPRARTAEDDLNRVTSSRSEIDFVVRDAPVAGAVQHGLFLPAPSRVDFALTVPAQGVFDATAVLLPPAADTGAASDGALFWLDVDDGGTITSYGPVELATDVPQDVRFDLDAHAGRAVRLTLRTQPGATHLLDYVFIAEPIVYVPKADPRRVLMVFVDTLRPDHLGVYGYERDTSPGIDAWSQGALVFEEARSPAPWTMPSARASVSGRQPARWDAGPHIGESLGEQGFTTVSVVGNQWISEKFDFAAGWSVHHYEGARVERRLEHVDRWLKRYPDRDLLLLLHVMEPHLPYLEPKQFQGLFAGTPPPSLVGRMDPDVIERAWAEAESDAERTAIRDYTIARYDQNIRYTDAQISPLLERFDGDLVVLYADHGEDFWDHGDKVMHGHSLSEQELRVPLILKGPGIEPGRSSAPVGLPDIVPTVFDALGLGPAPDADGVSLRAAKADRPQGFGWTLFGDEGWGTVVEGRKWITRSGRERVYDLGTDPMERVDLNVGGALDTKPFRDALGAFLHRPIVRAVRVGGPGRYWGMEPGNLQITLEHPAGFGETWTGWDPRERRRAPVVTNAKGLVMKPVPRLEVPREFFAMPGTPDADLGALSLEVTQGRKRWAGAWKDGVLSAGPSAWTLSAGPAWTPGPSDLRTYEVDEQMRAELEALGYVE